MPETPSQRKVLSYALYSMQSAYKRAAAPYIEMLNGFLDPYYPTCLTNRLLFLVHAVPAENKLDKQQVVIDECTGVKWHVPKRRIIGDALAVENRKRMLAGNRGTPKPAWSLCVHHGINW